MAAEPKPFAPFVPDSQSMPELTFLPVAVGALLGIVFGAASVYLVLKVGLTTSASIPVAVLAITVFKSVARTNILQNNIVQTTGSAGESIAFGVGLTMPALLILGFEIDVIRVTTVGVLGGLLGILMMIPLRRAFIVKQHHELRYPEGTACADVLIAGEKGGPTAQTLFFGFGLGAAYQFAMSGLKLWKSEPEAALSATNAAGQAVGLKAGAVACEVSAPLLGVGYIIGPRIASIMVAGGVLAYLVLVPVIATFGEGLAEPLAPAKWKVAPELVDPLGGVAGAAAAHERHENDAGLIRNMDYNSIRTNYILYIGAGAVAAGGILSMLQALPVIVGSAVAAFRDLRGGRGDATGAVPRTERDLPISVVLFGSLGMVVALAAVPALGLGLSLAGVAGAVMILAFGFLFVTVSSRITGEIGSSSNPISGMTVATLLLTCLLLLTLSEFGVLTIGKETKLLALTVAGVVCVACSNGGTTSQALKTGHLVGATPVAQQYAILVGSLTSALVVGVVLIQLNVTGTVYSKRNLPNTTVDLDRLAATDRVQVGQYADDATTYRVLLIGARERPDPGLFRLAPGEEPNVPPGRYLVGADGKIAYLCDPAINGELSKQDNGESAGTKFKAPKTQLIALIIDGVLDQNLPWGLVLIGVLIAVALELSGVPSLPFAVGVYLPLSSSTPIFLGGLVRWLVDLRRKSPEGEGDTSPGVLVSSGYIAGGSIAALLAATLEFVPPVKEALDLGKRFGDVSLFGEEPLIKGDVLPTVLFAGLAAALFAVGVRRKREETGSGRVPAVEDRRLGEP